MNLQQIAQDAENVFNTLAPVVASALPQGAAVVAGVQTAETVGNAMISNLPHHTAASDITTGLTALAGTPLVQTAPTVAAKLTGLALIWQDILKDLGIEK